MIKLLFTLLIGYRLVAQYEFPLYPVHPDLPEPNPSAGEKAFGYWLGGTGDGDLDFGPNSIVVDSKGNIIVCDPVSGNFKVIRDGKIVKAFELPEYFHLLRSATAIDDEDNIYLLDCHDRLVVMRLTEDSLVMLSYHNMLTEKINGQNLHPVRFIIINGKVYITTETSLNLTSSREDLVSLEGNKFLFYSGDSLKKELKEKWNIQHIRPIWCVFRIEGEDVYFLKGYRLIWRVRKGKGVIDSLVEGSGIFSEGMAGGLFSCPVFVDKKGRIYVVDGDFDWNTKTGKVFIRIYEPEKEN